ncbi:hypothetical protein UA08_06536 [Talaromyces atroroseus]|uniref:Uncharacterized protein n=1 Tax=Talaromyces atroroseus TaxID=1441469 RepID=A0A225ASD0_TALAT|nr:hypothetical protein UA08_06536 [Talaromyces atroroseus]OKL57866.1 hypothetical protein UA08_06536 [Talaromyces atroroseus]
MEGTEAPDLASASLAIRLQEYLNPPIPSTPPSAPLGEDCPPKPDADQANDELFISEHEPPRKRARRTPLLTSKEVRESVRIGLDDAYAGRIPSSSHLNVTWKATDDSKGRKKSKANELDFATLGGSNIIEDIRENSRLPSIPVSTKANKNIALQELVEGIPEAAQKDAAPDKRAIIKATKKFNYKPRSDRQGGWKHIKLQASLYHHQTMKLLGAAFMPDKRERENSDQKPYGANIVDGDFKVLDDNANTTLIVAPRGVIGHWKSQIDKHVRPNILGPILSHYAGSRVDSSNAVETMLWHKVILTSYDEVRNSYPKLKKPDGMTLEKVQRWAEKEFKENAGPLHQIRFRRIILDEGHQIRNPSSQTSIAVRALHAHYKWILSGTPLLKWGRMSVELGDIEKLIHENDSHNAEFWAYFNFLEVPHVGRFSNFLANFCSGSELANQRLTSIVKSVVFRRTHRSRLFECPIITLPEIGEKTVTVKPLAIEKALYNMIKDFFIDGINCIASSNDQEAQNRCFLTMLLKLRMLNSHLLCVQDILKKLLAIDVNLAELQSVLTANSENETDCSQQIFSVIHGLVMTGKQAKKPRAPATPLTAQFLKRVFEWMNNENQEECQTRMKCARCDALAARTRVTSCMHLICEDCFQYLKESDSSWSSKIVCPVCTDKNTVDTEDFDMDPSILSLRLGYMCAKSRENGSKKKPKKKISASATNSLFMSVFEENADEFNRRADIDWLKAEGEDMPSSKVIQTRDLIHKWMAEDPETKIVIFTQFRAMASIFGGMCRREKWAYVMLTGDMDFASRQQSIDDFQSKPEFQIMIASLKAGGVGLDLTSGNKCILVEPWWNDAIQQQAFCRLFRIGQVRNVEIVKLVATDTIDEYMMELQQMKLEQIEHAIGDATLPLTGVAGMLMKHFGTPEMNEDGGYTLHARTE